MNQKESCTALVLEEEDRYITTYLKEEGGRLWRFNVTHDISQCPLFAVYEEMRDYGNAVIEKRYTLPTPDALRQARDVITDRYVPQHREPAFYLLVRTGEGVNTHYKPFPMLAEAIFARKATRWERRQWEAIKSFLGIATVKEC